MSIRLSYAFAVFILLIAVVIRFTSFTALPPGFSDSEIDDIRIAETVQQGRVEVFYDLNGVGREGLYQTLMAGTTAIVGGGLFGYRILSLFVGLIGLALVYTLASRLCGPLAGMASMSLLAVNFAAVLLSRSVAREALLMAWTAAVMLSLARAFFVYGKRQYRPDSAAFLALGVLLGVGFYLHPISLVVTLFAMSFIIYRLFTERPFPRRALSFTWYMLMIMIVLSMPYVISTLQVPSLSGTTRLAGDFPPNVGSIISDLASGINGIFFVGDLNPTHNLPGRPLIDLVSGLMVGVGLLAVIRNGRAPGNALILLTLLFMTPAVLLAPLTPNFQVFAVYLPVLALLFGIGVSTIFYSLRTTGRRVSAVLLLILFAANVAWVTNDLRNVWAAQPQTQIAYHARLGAFARYLNRTGTTIPTLLCVEHLIRTDPYQLTDGQMLSLMLQRPDLPLRAADCDTTLILTNGGELQQIVLLKPIETVSPAFDRWLTLGNIINEPGLPLDSVVRVRAADALANIVGGFTTTSPITFAPDEPGGSQLAVPPLRLEGNLTFLGYERTWAEIPAPGDLLAIITYWRVDGVVPPDLQFFTHIQNDPAALPVAQRDTINVLPRLLQPRDVFIQVSYINLPFSLPDGEYGISVGAYEAGSGERLAAFDPNSTRERGSRLFIGAFRIQR